MERTKRVIFNSMRSFIKAAEPDKGKVQKKSTKKLTSVSFAFTHTYTLEKLTLLLFFPERTWIILKNVQNAKEKNISFHYIVPRTVKSSIHF